MNDQEATEAFDMVDEIVHAALDLQRIPEDRLLEHVSDLRNVRNALAAFNA